MWPQTGRSRLPIFFLDLNLQIIVLILTLVGWISGSGSRDSGMNTTTISFLAFQSFLIRSILAAASSLMGDPGDRGQSGQNQVWQSPILSTNYHLWRVWGCEGLRVWGSEQAGGQLSPVRLHAPTGQASCLKVSACLPLSSAGGGWEMDFHVLDSRDTTYILVLLLPQCSFSTAVGCGANCQVRWSALLYVNWPPLSPPSQSLCLPIRGEESSPKPVCAEFFFCFK